MQHQTTFRDQTNSADILVIDSKVDLQIGDSIVINGKEYIVFEVLYKIITHEPKSESVFHAYIDLMKS